MKFVIFYSLAERFKTQDFAPSDIPSIHSPLNNFPPRLTTISFPSLRIYRFSYFYKILDVTI